jgi:hypothetical protein
MTKPEGACLLCRAFAVVLLGVFSAGCSDPCRNTIIDTRTDPSGRMSAVLFQRDCGATTGFSTQISILDAGEKLSGSGNTFISDDGHSAADAASWGGPWVEMRWQSADHLLVRYDADSRTFEQDENVAGVRVTFKPVTR